MERKYLKDYAFVIVDFDTKKVRTLTLTKDNYSNFHDDQYVAVIGKLNSKRVKLSSMISDYNQREQYIKTITGEILDLGNKHPDYKAYENAINSTIPILKYFKFKKNHDDKNYIISGYTNMKEDVLGFVKTYDFNNNIIELVNGKKYFLDWFKCDKEQKEYFKVQEENNEIICRNFCLIRKAYDLSSVYSKGCVE